ncbi:MAG: transglutaminase family protein [Paracoccaceae bacterium]
MRLQISHTTRYLFDNPVSYGLQQLRKTPKSGHGQSVLSWQTQVIGGDKQVQFEDHHRNQVDTISFEKDCTELTVICRGEVRLQDTTGIVGRHIGPAPLWLYETATALTRPGTGVRRLLRGLGDLPDIERLHALSQAILDAVPYDLASEDAHGSAEEVLARGTGVCQDHTHVFLACARELGFPARYVSGYLMLDDRVEQDAMHAWAEAHVEGLGWVGFDVSNGISPDTRYVRVATGLDYAQAAPVIGTTLGGGGETLSVAIEVAQQ